MNIKDKITAGDVNKIFSNSKNKIKFIINKTRAKNTKEIFGKKPSINELNEWIIENWNYEYDLKIIRDMYTKTEKYISAKNSHEGIINLIKHFKREYPNLELSWPCEQSLFDSITQKLNNNKDIPTHFEKDCIIKNWAIRFRYMKVLKTLINDKMEYEIFKTYKDILPTLKHKSKSDFYINGEVYDQKTTVISKKFLKKFREKNPNVNINKYGDWLQDYGKWLYEDQGKDRFGWQPRLFVLAKKDHNYININAKKLTNAIKNSGFENKTYETSFIYKKNQSMNEYSTKFKVILIPEK